MLKGGKFVMQTHQNGVIFKKELIALYLIQMSRIQTKVIYSGVLTTCRVQLDMLPMSVRRTWTTVSVRSGFSNNFSFFQHETISTFYRQCTMAEMTSKKGSF